MKSHPHLLHTRRFLPLFLTQFLGAFNDNLFKNALVIMIMYAGLEVWGVSSGVLVAAAGGIFILPFFLFSATAGQLADKYEKSAIIRLVKVWEIALMLLAAAGFYLQNTPLLLLVLFLMGAQSTFFGPVKYSILPDHLRREELIAGNALVEAATFVAILLGTIGGGLLIATQGGREAVAAGLVMVAALGFLSSLFIPKAPAPLPALVVGWNILGESWKIMGFARDSRPVFLSILGISWFWLIGAVFLSTLPVYVKQTVGGNEGVVTWFMTMFSLGVGLGSLLCNRLLDGEIDTRYVPLGAFGMTLFGLDLWLASQGLTSQVLTNPMQSGATTVFQFLSSFSGWRISTDLFMIAACGGLYIVPLYAVMQTRCKEEQRARVIAANNVMNALFMVASAGGAAAMLGMGAGPATVFLCVSLLNGGAYFVIRSLAVESGDRPVLRLILGVILRSMYTIRLRGGEHLAAAEGNTMIVANHQSFLDGLMIAVFFPGKYSFVVNRFMSGRWWARLFLSLVDTHTMDSENPMAIKKLVKILRAGGRLIIFPEGRITITGALMKIHPGPALIARKAGASILPVRIEGANLTHFSRMTGKIAPRLFTTITMTAMPPRHLEISPSVEERQSGHRNRGGARNAMEEIMTEMMFQGADIKRTIPMAALDSCSMFGGEWPIAEQSKALPTRFGKLLEQAARIGAALEREVAERNMLGVMLPNSVDAVMTVLGVQSAGGTVAMMDTGWNPETIRRALRAGGIKTVVTTRGHNGAALEQGGARVIHIEDINASFGVGAVFSRGVGADPDSAAAAFYIEEEGDGGWMVHSHGGLLANAYQLSAVMDMGPADTILAAPSLATHPGMLLGMMIPLVTGMKAYTSHSFGREAAAACYDSNATVIFGDEEFVFSMGQAAHRYDLANVRRVLIVGEPHTGISEEEWSERLGLRPLRVFGGVGPGIISANSPMRGKRNTAGYPLPGVRFRHSSGEEGDGGRKLEVRSPGGATGYIASGVLTKFPLDGWHAVPGRGMWDEDRFPVMEDDAG